MCPTIIHKSSTAEQTYTPVKRSLFGRVDHEEVMAFLEDQLQKIQNENIRRWNFDFIKEQPIKGGSFVWEKMASADILKEKAPNNNNVTKINISSNSSTLLTSHFSKCKKIKSRNTFTSMWYLAFNFLTLKCTMYHILGTFFFFYKGMVNGLCKKTLMMKKRQIKWLKLWQLKFFSNVYFVKMYKDTYEFKLVMSLSHKKGPLCRLYEEWFQHTYTYQVSVNEIRNIFWPKNLMCTVITL